MRPSPIAAPVLTLLLVLPQALALALALALGLALVPPQALAQGEGGAAPGQDGESLLELRIADQTVLTEIADTPGLRRIGLMYRRELPVGRGMLFVFQNQPQQRCFWMRNTLVPLDVLFLRADGVILQVESMRPMSDRSHCSRWPVSLALELPANWLASHNRGPGDRVLGLEALASRTPAQ